MACITGTFGTLRNRLHLSRNFFRCPTKKYIVGTAKEYAQTFCQLSLTNTSTETYYREASNTDAGVSAA